jgi:predicted nucleotidyltransferase
MGSVTGMKINLDSTILDQVDMFCQRWQVAELSLFGSVLRDDFGAKSDIDILVTFYPDANWGLLDHVQMTMDLKAIFKKEVDLITRRGLESSSNWLRRDNILKTAQLIYDGGGIIYALR